MKSSVILLVFVFSLIPCFTEEKKCRPEITVDITENDNTFNDNTTNSNFDYRSNSDVIKNCICVAKTCVRKCCQKHEEIGPNRTCATIEKFRHFVNDIPSNFTHEIVYGFLNCQDVLRMHLYPIIGRESEEFLIDSNGHLINLFLTVKVDYNNYCLEYFSSLNTLGALVCAVTSEKQQSYEAYYYYYGN